jgi:tyrosine decarboxylase/aspartate 1-decarboxylase
MPKINKDKKYQKILKNLEEYKKQDFTFSSGHILGSMCTQPLPIAFDAYMKFLDTNLGDPELFTGTKKIEQKYLSFMCKLLNAPKTTVGQIGSGGTEGNINAIWLAKKVTGKKEIIIPESAHFSFEKIASLMDMNLVTIPLTKDYVVDISKVEEKINKNTAAIVGIAGSTELGTVDPIPKLSRICLKENIFLHIDAAFGGYIIPFLKKLNYNIPDFDFKLKGVSTVSIDAHKMGCAAIPLGILLVRNKNWLENISVNTPYISTKKQSGIIGTRSGAPVVAAYAVSEYLGLNGYQKIVKTCMQNTEYTYKRIREIGLTTIIKPVMNVIGVKLNNPCEIEKRLTKLGWKINKMQRLSAIRIVLMPHISKDIIDKFLPDLKKVCKETKEL